MVPLFMSFQSIRLLPLCFPWLSSLSQVLFRLQQSAKITPYVCVFFHAHYKYLWVWVYHLLPAHVPISLSEWWGSCVQMLQCAHNNVTRKQEVTVRMNWKLKKKKNPERDQIRETGKSYSLPVFSAADSEEVCAHKGTFNTRDITRLILYSRSKN